MRTDIIYKQIRYRILLCILVFIGKCGVCAQQATSVDAGINYIVEVTPLSDCSSITMPNQNLSSSGLSYSGTVSTTQGIVTCQYFNGKGELIQESVLNSSDSHNLTSQFTYDAIGRLYKQWLPVSNNAAGGYVNNYDALAAERCNTPYVEYTWEQSPLSRELKNRNVSSYHSHPATTSYLSNTANEVKRFSGGNNTLVCSGYYPAGTLSKTVVSDPDDHLTTEYKDALGRLIMQRQGQNADTYYVYNALNQLTYVLPPALSDCLQPNNTYVDNNEAVRNYAYIYRYDIRGNICYKQLPGCEPIYFLYDVNNRLVLQQDGNQRERGAYWLVYAYDNKGRIVYTLEMCANQENLADLRQVVESSDFTARFAAATGPTTLLSNTGYFCDFLPGECERILTVSYYDNYAYLSLEPQSNRSLISRAFHQGYTTGNAAPNGAKGILTGKRVYNLTDGNYSVTSYYYDSRDRLIQQHSTNGMGGADRIFYLPSFTDKILKQYSIHTTANSSTSEEYSYVYDNQDRLIETRYKHNNDTEYVLSAVQYDEYGQLKNKSIYNYIDTIRYEYDPRSCPKKISASSGFEENIYYGSNIDVVTNHPCFNGNVSAVLWSYGNKTNGYAYDYDGYNRLVEARATDNGNYWDNHYTSFYSYDKQGNICEIFRWDNNDLMNNLVLRYEGNHLTKVTDNGYPPVSYNEKYYHDGSDEQIEMLYDQNGNLIADFDRNICAIRYNVLNLPDTIQFANGNQIVHVYDAEGNRLQTTYYTRRVATVVPALSTLPSTDNLQEYAIVSQANVGNKRYKRSGHGAWQLDYVFNPEGYTRYYGQEEHYRFYYIKDYLGNVREVYVNPEPGYKECVQRTQYYPSGLPWNEGLVPIEQPFKYNGKEFVEMHGLDEYDSEARWYYPAIMRTTTMDPLCEKYYSTSPYAWCGNNPVNLIDPDGRDTVRVGYNIEVGQWEISSHVISEGDDLLIITNANGEEQLCAFNEGEYGNRICSVRLGGSDIQTFGVFFLSGCDVAGFFVEPAGEPNNDAVNQQPLELGVYDISKNTGDKWTGWPRQGNAGFPKERAACIHYAGNHGKDYALRNQNLSAVLWTTKCMVVATNYSKRRDGTVIFNSIDSFNTAKSVARYCGATKFNMRTKSNGNGNYYICSGWTNSTVQRIIKSR